MAMQKFQKIYDRQLFLKTYHFSYEKGQAAKRAVHYLLGIIRAMKNSNIKFVAGLVLMTASLVLLHVSTGWVFFLGLGLVVFSALLSSRPRQRTRRDIVIRWFSTICVLAFFGWLHLYHDYKMSLVGLVSVWLTWVYFEVSWWRSNRSLSHDA